MKIEHRESPGRMATMNKMAKIYQKRPILGWFLVFFGQIPLKIFFVTTCFEWTRYGLSIGVWIVIFEKKKFLIFFWKGSPLFIKKMEKKISPWYSNSYTNRKPLSSLFETCCFKNYLFWNPAQKMTKSAKMPKNWSTLSDDRSPWAHFYRHLSLSNNYLGLV